MLVNDGIAERVRERVTDAAMSADEVMRELAIVARLSAFDSKLVSSKVRALELLGRYYKLFNDDSKQPQEVILRVRYGGNDTDRAGD